MDSRFPHGAQPCAASGTTSTTRGGSHGPGSITTRSLLSGWSSPVLSMCWRSRALPVAASRQVYAEPGGDKRRRLETPTRTLRVPAPRGERVTAAATRGKRSEPCWLGEQLPGQPRRRGKEAFGWEAKQRSPGLDRGHPGGELGGQRKGEAG